MIYRIQTYVFLLIRKLFMNNTEEHYGKKVEYRKRHLRVKPVSTEGNFFLHQTERERKGNRRYNGVPLIACYESRARRISLYILIVRTGEEK